MNSEQLIVYFQVVVQEIFEGVLSSNDLLEDKNKKALLASIFDALDRLGVTIDQVIPEEMMMSYFGGMDEAAASLSELGLVVEGGLSLTASGQIAEGFNRRIHLEAVDELVSDSLLDFKAAIRTAKESAEISISSALDQVKTEIAKGMIKGHHSKVAKQAVAKAFTQNGLTAFVTKDGKKLPLDYYSALVTRTKMREANTKGATNRYLENDVGLIQIEERSDTCAVCSKYKGLVVSLTGEHEDFKTSQDIKLPPYHPHCRGTVRPFVHTFKTEKEMNEAQKKSSSFNPDKDTRTPAQKRAYEKEQKIRRQANAEKKQYARWKALLGKDAPKTLGAFRRMKRQNTVRFQELQSEYMSLSQQLRSQ